MDAIKVISRKTESGNYKIELHDIGNDAEINVIIIKEDKTKKKLLDLSEFTLKIEWKNDPIAYQKMIRNEC